MIIENGAIYLGKAEAGDQHLLLKYANRHGLIAGATGTGKTLSLQGLAEGFSKAGVPVFIADVKSDLSGLASAGVQKTALIERAQQIGFPLQYAAMPAIFWDVFGKDGHPIRTTISEMGPLMLARLLELNDTQEGVLNIAFRVADEEGLLLLDMDDLRAMLTHIGENSAEISQKYGNVAAASIGAIQRGLLALESQGAKQLFGEPALQIADLLKIAPDGRGAVNILSAVTLMQTPKLYTTLLLWLLSELFEHLPEVGDMEKPKLVFFFDEAHLLFNNANPALLEKIEQLVRLIRSKGVGVYFITQNPADIPANVLGQLSNRIQHALRAFTPQDTKDVKAAAQTFRTNPAFDTEDAITLLGVGEALVSTLDAKGVPTMVEKTLIRPPVSLVGPISAELRNKLIAQSPLAGVYDTPVNRESAYEILNQRITQPATAANTGSIWGNVAHLAAGAIGGGAVAAPQARTATGGGVARTSRTSARQPESLVASVGKSVLKAAGSQIGRQIARGILGAMLK